MSLPAPKLRPFCELEVALGPPRELGDGRFGGRRIIPIVGGTVTGEVSGRILNLGADWQTVRGDFADLDTRYAFETDDGALVEIVNKGYRHGPPDVVAALARGEDVAPDAYYMRTTARLETGDVRYAWVNRMVFVGVGGRLASAVRMALYAVE